LRVIFTSDFDGLIALIVYDREVNRRFHEKPQEGVGMFTCMFELLFNFDTNAVFRNTS